MIRLVPLIVAGMQFVGSLAAWAQSTAPEGDDARYTFNRVNDGYLRLDGRTGQVSVCTQRPAGWACQPVPDEPRLQLPNDADLDRVMNFIEKVWRRLVEMVTTLHKDMLKKT